jgi:multicomponent Na+:H+ antiporter subunit A
MLVALAFVFGLAAMAPTLQKFLRGASGWVFAIVPAGVFLYCLSSLLALPETGAVVQTTPWIPSFGIELAFRLDGLGLLFLLLVSGIGTLISIYAGGYLHGHSQLGRFFCYLFFFMGAMLGVVSADNLIALFIFWELTSLSSYLLIGFNHEQKESRASALQALLVTFAGGQFLLLGFVILGWVGGSFSLPVLLEQADAIKAGPWYIAIVLLVLMGAFTKSAQTPFHFWLPGAMAAPTPVSAYLHSATMVTVGVFLMARLTPLLGGTPLWSWLLISVGLLTMVVGSVLAVGQTDLKRLLAYTTVGALGTMTLLLGMGTPLAAQAAVAFLLVHSLYKGAMFMMAGTVDHETHTRDVRDLGGLFRHMPITASAAAIAALAMCGIPPVLGFISKELIYEAKLQLGSIGWVLAGFGVAANALVVAVALIVGVRPFVGKPLHTPKHPHEAPPSLWLGPVTLAALGLIFGLFPFLVDKSLLTPAVESILKEPVKMKLYLWHGLTPMLVLSIITLLLGVGFYVSRHKLRLLRDWMHPVTRFGPDHFYQKLVYSYLPGFAEWQTRMLQHGYLRYYVMMVLAAAFGAIAIGLTRVEIPGGWLVWRPFEWYEVVICAAIFLAGISAIVTNRRITAVVLLGIVGYSIALIFALYGAPDLAITQFLVETLSIILFVLVIYHLPQGKSLSSMKTRLRDAGLSILLGVAVTLMLMKALTVDPEKRLTSYFMENALLAQGRNVVNVILVDFRAIDTLGEVVVLAVAGLGVYAVLRFGRSRRKDRGEIVNDGEEKS